MPHEEIGDIQNCWVPEEQVAGTFGCTQRLGSPTHDTVPDATLQAVVVAAQDVSVSRLLAHEIAAHWSAKGLKCSNHAPSCWDQALEARLKDGIQ